MGGVSVGRRDWCDWQGGRVDLEGETKDTLVSWDGLRMVD